MLNNLINIWQKELMDTFRDKKALRQTLLVPLILGIFYAILNPLLGTMINNRQEEPITVPVQGLEYADETLLDIFAQFEITLEPFTGDMEPAITAGHEAAGLIIPEGFQEQVANEESASISLLINPTAGGPFGGGFSSQRLRLALSTYNQLVSVNRLQMRNVDPALLEPVALDTQDLSTSEQRAGMFAALMLPILVGVLAAQGSIFIAIDVTAGEKERGTLEALLVTPTSDWEVFVGKLAAVFTMSLIPIVLTLIGYWAASNLLPDSMTGGNILPFTVILKTILITLPLALPINVVLMMISIRTKTFKDAQSAAAPLVFVATFTAMAAAFLPPTSAIFYLIPIYGTAAVVSTLAASGVLMANAVLFSVLGSLATAVVGIGLALQLFNRERLLYSA